jgi:hypothetical protein
MASFAVRQMTSAGVIEAIGDQMMHTLLAHIAEGHRQAGRFDKSPIVEATAILTVAS